MRNASLTSLLASFFLLPASHLLSAPGEDAEMQARARNCLLNRGALAMDKLTESPDLAPSQIVAIDLLLQELRLQMRLFLDSSGLEGDALQAKLQDLLEVARYKIGSEVLTQPAASETTTTSVPKASP